MSFLDKAKKAMQGRSRTIEQGIDKAAEQVDRRTGGKYRDRLAKGADAVKSRAREMDPERSSAGEVDRERPSTGDGDGDGRGTRP